MYLIVILFAVSSLLLVAGAMLAIVLHQRRFLRTRIKLGGRLLVAQDEERRRIAQELHGDVLQRLTVATTRLGAASLQDIPVIQANLDQLAADLRHLARGMHPGVVDHLPLEQALGALTESMTTLTGGIRLVCADFPPLTPDQKLSIYRVVQDALSNVVRHAPQASVCVTLTSSGGAARVCIHDTGPGFDLKSAMHGDGLGLRSMRERCEFMGGRLEVVSTHSEGTQVIATFPAVVNAHIDRWGRPGSLGLSP